MKKFSASVVSVYADSSDDPGKDEPASIHVELDGILGNRYRSFQRETWTGDKQSRGTVRRNERQWSGVSIEELAAIGQALGMDGPLSAELLGANICFAGIPEFSRLPKGTLLTFPSGAELLVEEYNPPCQYMGKRVARLPTRSGRALSAMAFSTAAKLTRGVVGVVEVPGVIRAGDSVIVQPYETPRWLIRTAD